MATTKGEFRRELIERLALTNDARSVAHYGHQEGLADRLGVTEDVLAEAAVLARAGFAPKVWSTSGAQVLRMEMNPTAPLAMALSGCATDIDVKPITLVRSMLHAAMLSTCEPSPREKYSKWGPLPGSEAIRKRYTDLSQINVTGNHRYSMRPLITVGLRDALDRRAQAYGTTRARYVLLWLAELVDGRLVHFKIVPVEVRQMLDAADAYVLPLPAK